MRRHAHRLAHPAAGDEARTEAAAVVRGEYAPISRVEIRRRHLGRECRQAHGRVETPRSERRDRAGRVADQQPALVRDATQDAADRNETAATLDGAAAGDALPEPLQRFRRIEAIAIPGHADVLLLPVV